MHSAKRSEIERRAVEGAGKAETAFGEAGLLEKHSNSLG